MPAVGYRTVRSGTGRMKSDADGGQKFLRPIPDMDLTAKNSRCQIFRKFFWCSTFSWLRRP